MVMKIETLGSDRTGALKSFPADRTSLLSYPSSSLLPSQDKARKDDPSLSHDREHTSVDKMGFMSKILAPSAGPVRDDDSDVGKDGFAAPGESQDLLLGTLT